MRPFLQVPGHYIDVSPLKGVIWARKETAVPIESGAQTPLQKALTWIKDQQRLNPSLSRFQLIDEASCRFNLSPRDGEFLHRALKEGKEG